MVDRLEKLMTSIFNDQNIIDNLDEMKIILGNLPSTELKSVSQKLSLEVLFDRLNCTDSEQIEGICHILKIVLPASDNVFQNYSRQIILVLGHPEPVIKETILNWFSVYYEQKGLAHITVFLASDEFLLRLIECLADKITLVGLKAADIITKIGIEPNGINILFSKNSIVRKIKQICEEDETVKIRVYQVICNIGASSPEGFFKIDSLSLYKDLFKNLDTGDILASLAILEVLAPLALTMHGYEYLYKYGVLKEIIHELENIESNPIGIAQFFGRLAKAFPVVFQKNYPQVVPALLKALDMEDDASFVAALEVLGMIAYSHEGKQLFQQQDRKLMSHAILRIKDAVTKLPVQWRGRILTAIANLLHVEQSSSNIKTKLDEHLSNVELSKKWFIEIGGDKFLETIFEFMKQPFPDVKIAAYSVLEQISSLPWGQVLIGQNPALIEFLIERKPALDEEEKQAKFYVVKTMAESPTSRMTLAAFYKKLLAFVNHIENGGTLKMEVAIEGAE